MKFAQFTKFDSHSERRIALDYLWLSPSELFLLKSSSRISFEKISTKIYLFSNKLYFQDKSKLFNKKQIISQIYWNYS